MVIAVPNCNNVSMDALIALYFSVLSAAATKTVTFFTSFS